MYTFGVVQAVAVDQTQVVLEVQVRQVILLHQALFLYHPHRLTQHLKLQSAVEEQADHQEAVRQVVQMEKERQHSQVVKAVTLDHNHIQAQAEVAEEPQQYSLTEQQ